MSKRSSTKLKAAAKPKCTGTERDFMTVARHVVEQAIGEKLDGSPAKKPLKPVHRTPVTARRKRA